MFKKTIVFTFLRYFTFLLQLIRGFVLAKILDPSLFGIFGFLTMIQLYLTYCSLGIPYAINLDLASQNDTYKDPKDLIPESFTICILLCLILGTAGFAVWLFDIPLFSKYSFNDYSFIVAVIGGFAILKELFQDIYQVFGELKKIALIDVISASILLAVCFTGTNLKQIWIQLISTLLMMLISILLYIYKSPFKLSFRVDLSKIKHLITLGINLAASSLSFYLIMLSNRTIVSAFYSLEQMGHYSLANSIANATMLGLNAISWAVYPKIISHITNVSAEDQRAETVRTINRIYNTAVFLTVYVMILLSPVIFVLLPKYKATEPILIALLLSQAFLSCGFGYASLANAFRKQLMVTKLNIISLFVVIVLSILFSIYNMPLTIIAMITVLGFIIYLVLLVKYGTFLLNQKFKKTLFRDILTPSILISSLIIIIGILSGLEYESSIIALLIFTGGAWRNIKELFEFIKIMQ